MNLCFYEYIIYMLRHEDWSIDSLDMLCLLESMDFYGIMKEYYMLINVSSSMLFLGRFLPIAIRFSKSDSLNIIPFLTLMMKWIYVCGRCIYLMFCTTFSHEFKLWVLWLCYLYAKRWSSSMDKFKYNVFSLIYGLL